MSTDLQDIYRDYRALCADVDQEFGRVRDIFIERMQCQKGCSSCCSQLFSISVIEAAHISGAVKELDSEPREQMRQRAREYLTELTEGAFDEAEGIEEHSRVVEEALNKLVGRHHIPCPALVDDACSVYTHRPILARKFGIPLWNPKKPNELQACELNFKAGEVIQMDGLIEPQVELEYRWLSLKTGVDEDLGLPDLVATVASAVVFDYEAYLESRVPATKAT